MAYVPPALRRKQEAAAKGERGDKDEPKHGTSRRNTVSTIPSIADIQNHFWPGKEVAIVCQEDTPVRKQYEVKDLNFVAQRAQGEDIKIGQDDRINIREAEKEIANNSDLEARGVHAHSTLNGSEAEPDKLKYVLLFHNAVSANINVSWKLSVFSHSLTSTAPKMDDRPNNIRQI